MESAIIFAGFTVCGWLSWYATGQFVLFALRRRVIDVPNARSSHTFATPRGGGIAFASVFLIVTVLLGVTGHLRSNELLGLACGILPAAVGFADDCRGMGILIRFLVQIAASGMCVLCLALIPFHPFGYPVIVIACATACLIVATTWVINLVNFMDGIDGLAATEIITVATVCFLLVFSRHGLTSISLLFGILAVVVTGFLLWNWNPAHVFMGDAGSCFLGYTVAALAFLAASRGELHLQTPFLLLGVFIVDATMTLGRRMLRGEQWYRPHRMHAFQHAAKQAGHRKTTLAVAALNLLWLTPWAALLEFRPGYSAICFIIAWSPLVALAHALHAGEPLPHRPRWIRLSALLRISPNRLNGSQACAILRRLGGVMIPLRAAILVLISVASLLLALLTTSERRGLHAVRHELSLVLLWAGSQFFIWLVFGLHRRHWHLVVIEEVPDIVGMSVAGVAVGAICGLVTMNGTILAIPPLVFLLDAILSSVFLVGVLVLCATLHRTRDARFASKRRIRVLIYGANAAGVTILVGLRRLCPECFPVGLVDAKRSPRGTSVSGLPVLGSVAEIGELVKTYNIDQVLLSSQGAETAEGQQLIGSCEHAAIDCYVIPSVRDMLNGNANNSGLRPSGEQHLATFGDLASDGAACVLPANAAMLPTWQGITSAKP